MKRLTMFLFLLTALFTAPASSLAQQATEQTSSAAAAPKSQTEAKTPQKTEEKADPNKEYREMFDKLLDRALWAFGVVATLLVGLTVWLVRWTLGQSQKEARQVLQDELQKRGLAELEAEIKRLQAQHSALNAFKNRRVDWLLPANVPEPAKELAFLRRAGLEHVTPIPVAADQPGFALNDPDLVILSFDATPQSKDLMKHLVTLLKRNQNEVPVLIYAPLGLRVDPPEMALLNQTALHALANFPATLVTQALELVRLRQS